MNDTQDPTSPEREIRTDLWPTLPINMLTIQRELVMDRMTKLYSMMGSSAAPSTIGMYRALETALTDLSELIDHRSSSKKSLKDSHGKGQKLHSR